MGGTKKQSSQQQPFQQVKSLWQQGGVLALSSSSLTASTAVNTVQILADFQMTCQTPSAFHNVDQVDDTNNVELVVGKGRQKNNIELVVVQR